MAARQFLITPLKDLRPFKTSWRIQVKILHAYKQYSLKSGETIELIIADESGAKMSVTVRKEHVKKFERCLVVGSWKIITTMTLNPVTGNYRVSDLTYKIAFLYNTSVAPSEVVNDSKFLSFAKFDAILAGSLNTNILSDVIGQVVDCGEVKDLITNNKSNRKIDFNLLDVENNRVPCTLWGKFAEMIDEANQQSTDGMVICLIRFAKLGVFNEIRNVSNAFDASQVIIDTDLPEIVEIRRIFSAHVGALTPISDLGQKRICVPSKIDACLQYPRLIISELLLQSEVGKCRTLCTVHSFDTDWPWYYISCRNCNRKVIQEDSIKLEDVKIKAKPRFWCETCNNYAKSVVPKFWFHLIIMDQSGHAKCMLFDSFAKELLGGITAEELLNGNYTEIEDPAALPNVLTGICGQTYQFLLCHQRENVIGGYDSYNVAKVWLPNKIQELLMIEESDLYLDPNSIISGDQGSLMITNGESISDDPESLQPVTPASKRKSDGNSGGTDESSTNKKPCPTNVVVLDEELPKEGLVKNLEDVIQEN